MLTITVAGDEHWDEENERFVYPEAFELQLEHSLVALSKWESKFEKPFLAETPRTTEETVWYVYFMILTPDVDFSVMEVLSDENYQDINTYIDSKMTATWFNDTQPESKTGETITAELIYYWMNMFGIPLEMENWHLQRLFTLIRIHNLKAQAPKKMSQREIHQRNRELNRKRREELGTKG